MERLEALEQEIDRLKQALFDVAKFTNMKNCGEIANYALNHLSSFR